MEAVYKTLLKKHAVNFFNREFTRLLKAEPFKINRVRAR